MTEIIIKDLWIYPIKGCRGYAVNKAVITPRGMDGDREYALLLDGQPINQKQLPALGQLGARYDDAKGLYLTFANRGDYYLPKTSEPGPTHDISILGARAVGMDMGDEVANWLQDALGQAVRLVRLKQSFQPKIPLPEFDLVNVQAQDKFVDVAPILLTSQTTLDDLNERLDVNVPMNRFRPNIVVEGLSVFAEDDRVDYEFPAVTLNRITVCERCIVTTITQGDSLGSNTHPKEPLLTLSKYRKRSEHYAGGIMFGIYLMPASDGTVSLRDRVVQ